MTTMVPATSDAVRAADLPDLVPVLREQIDALDEALIAAGRRACAGLAANPDRHA